MRKALGAVQVTAVRVARGAASWQGIAGVGCIAGSLYLLTEQWGWALLAVGVFLLLGAWGNR